MNEPAIVTIIERYHIPLKQDGRRYMRGIEHDSLVVDLATNSYHWNVFDEHGGPVNWIMNREGCDRQAALAMLGQDYQPATPPRPPATPPPAGPTAEQLAALGSRAAYYHDKGQGGAWWHKEGISDQAIERFMLGYADACPTYRRSPSYTIPVTEAGQVVSIRHRLALPSSPGDKYRPEFAGLPALLFNVDALARAYQPLGELMTTPYEAVLTEGEKKAIRLDMAGFKATGAPGFNIFKPEWYGRFHQVDLVYIALDPDQDPVKAAKIQQKAQEIARGFMDRGKWAKVASLPAKIDDLLSAGMSPAEVYRRLQAGEDFVTDKARVRIERKLTALRGLAARRRELASRHRAVFDPGAIPFNVADDEEYRQWVVTARAAFTSATAWQEHVLLYFPELDAAHELAVKLAENREQRQDYCGRPVLKFMPDGSHEIGHWCCGYCERCKHEQARLIKEKINGLISSRSHSMEIIYFQVETKEERRQWVRWLKAHELLYQVLPVHQAGAVAFDILAEYNPALEGIGEFVDPLTLGQAQLESWVNTPAGERRSGKLLGNIRELWKEFEHRPVWACDKDDPDACEIEIPGVVLVSSEFEPPACEEDVTTLEELQSALYDCHKRFVDQLIKRKAVILSVYSKICYTPKTTIPALLADFNRRQAELREARKQPPGPNKAMIDVIFAKD